MERTMQWMVYRDNWNSRKIEAFNVFEHGSFNKDVNENLDNAVGFDDFAVRLKSSLMYYFWSKAEYEILLAPWIGGKEERYCKIDIYDQVMLNWEQFAAYCWSQKG